MRFNNPLSPLNPPLQKAILKKKQEQAFQWMKISCAVQTEEEEFVYLKEKSIRLLKLLETNDYDISRLSSALFIELGAQYDRHIYEM